MPVAYLQFRLPDEEAEHNDALQGAEWRRVAEEFDLWLRNEIKHRKLSRARKTVLEEARERLREEVCGRGLELP